MEQEKLQKQRTLKQNKALHKYCQELADELSARGVTMQAFISNIEVDHTMQSVKEAYRSIAKVKFGKSHTADLTTTELTQVYEEINRHVAQWGIEMAFPSQENSEGYEDSLLEASKKQGYPLL